MNTSAPQAVRRLLGLAAGLLVWSSGFVWLYAVLSVGCQLVERTALISLALLLVWVLHLLAMGWLLHRWRRRGAAGSGAENGRFWRRTELVLLLVSLGGLIAIGFPALLLPPCP